MFCLHLQLHPHLQFLLSGNLLGNSRGLGPIHAQTISIHAHLAGVSSCRLVNDAVIRDQAWLQDFLLQYTLLLHQCQPLLCIGHQLLQSLEDHGMVGTPRVLVISELAEDLRHILHGFIADMVLD